MKRSVLSALLCFLSAVSLWAGDGYLIKGTTVGLNDGVKLYLIDASVYPSVALDSVVTANRQFRFEGNCSKPRLCYLAIGDNFKQAKILTDFFLEPGTSTVLCGSPFTSQRVVGTELNDIYQQYKDSTNYYNHKIQTLLSANQTDSIPYLTRKASEYKSESIEKNLNNMVGVMLFVSYANRFSDEQQLKWIEKIPEALQTEEVNFIKTNLLKANTTKEGKPMIDLAMDDLQGVQHRLSDLVKNSKYTLVDFWASWCGPCRKEIPLIKKLYEKYKDLQIIGISFDNNKVNWEKTVRQLQMQWLQLSDLKGWHSVAAQEYGIRSIPETLLIDRNGTIVARGLRGEELEAKIAELLGETR